MNGDERIKKSLVEFRINGEMPLSEVSRRLVKGFASLGDYAAGEKSYNILNSIFLVARKGTLLRSGDVVKDEHELEIMAPLERG